MRRRLAFLAVLAVLLAPSLQAQQPPVPAAQPGAPAAQQPAPEPPAPAYTYKREGRRDPFVSLIGRAGDTGTASRPPGLPGMLINEVSLKGIVKQTDGGFVAMLQGPDKRTYPVRPGQKLLDGSVKSITQDTVIFAQDVDDPLSLVKQREVRKTLRASEEGRG